MTMTDLCEELRNWFIRSNDDIHKGTFKIENGIISPPFSIVENQYYRIEGSLFNDGVHIFSSSADESLADETFSGAVSAMTIPPTVIALMSEINAWLLKYEDAVNSPYQSESFGGYSYSKNGDSNGGSWQKFFSKRLNKWRKI